MLDVPKSRHIYIYVYILLRLQKNLRYIERVLGVRNFIGNGTIIYKTKIIFIECQ